MEHTVSRLTVFFEAPFWVGVYERENSGALEAAKVVFGAEPKEYEVYEYFLTHWSRLRFSPPVAVDTAPERRENPKRMQRGIQKKLLERSGVGTKAQQAIQAQRELLKTEGKARRKQRALDQKKRQFALRQEKKKEKHRGR